MGIATEPGQRRTERAAAARNKGRRGRPRDGRLDAAIVEATVAEVSERGWGGARIDAIASRAGVSKPTIYRRWPSKDDLFHFVATRVNDQCEQPATGDLHRDLVAIFEPMAERLADEQLSGLVPTLIAEGAQNGSIRAVVREFAQQRRRPAVDCVVAAIERGDLDPATDPDVVADLIAGALVYRLYLLGEPIGPPTVELVIDQALRGLDR